MAERFSTGFVNKVNTIGPVKTVMANGVMAWFDGNMPANADAAEGSVNLLALFTVDAGVFVPGQAANGLNMDQSVDGVLSKDATELWKALGTAAAGPLPGKIATWGRWYDNSYTTGADTSSARVDFQIGTTSSYEVQVANAVVVEDNPITLNEYNFTLQKQ